MFLECMLIWMKNPWQLARRLAYGGKCVLLTCSEAIKKLMRTQWRTKKETIALHHVAGSSHVHKDWVTLIQTSSWSLHHEFSTWCSENLIYVFFFVRQSALCWDTPTYAPIGARSMQTMYISLDIYIYYIYIRYIYILYIYRCYWYYIWALKKFH